MEKKFRLIKDDFYSGYSKEFGGPFEVGKIYEASFVGENCWATVEDYAEDNEYWEEVK